MLETNIRMLLERAFLTRDLLCLQQRMFHLNHHEILGDRLLHQLKSIGKHIQLEDTVA